MCCVMHSMRRCQRWGVLWCAAFILESVEGLCNVLQSFLWALKRCITLCLFPSTLRHFATGLPWSSLSWLITGCHFLASDWTCKFWPRNALFAAKESFTVGLWLCFTIVWLCLMTALREDRLLACHCVWQSWDCIIVFQDSFAVRSWLCFKIVWLYDCVLFLWS